MRRPLTRARVRPLIGHAAALTALAVGLALAPAAPAAADHERLPQGRDLRTYTVRAGDTATGLAVRFHAWTAELISHNHLDSSGGLRVGQRIEIPVVTQARDKDRSTGGQGAGSSAATPSRDRVRRTITRAANHRGVDPQLALAIAWQESGWQMHHVSSAGAIGAMQVLPGTGRWMEYYAGRDLRLRVLKDNATAGVLLLGVLADHTRTRRHMIGAYYQGLGALREHGLYDETKAYVANVQAIRRRLEAGRPPA